MTAVGAAVTEAEIYFEYDRASFGNTCMRVPIAGGSDRLTLTCDRPVQVEPARGAVVGNYLVAEGDTIVLTLHHRRAELDGAAGVTDTVAGWQSWTAAHAGYERPYLDQVMRSGLVLQALTYRPTGAVVAAATTSVPEVPGGRANWDYRFGWLRDGSFTLKALWVAACPDEGERFFDWIAQSCGPLDGRDAPVMLGAGGERDLSERSLDHLAGYGGARPVRIGNDAWRQKQLDVYGEVLECAWVLHDQLDLSSPNTKHLLRALADRAADTWGQRDAGIWEGREGDRHYVTSKVMCWVALERAVRLADRIEAADHVAGWEAAREEIREAILRDGWDEDKGAFTGAFGFSHLDAGVVLISLVGFLDPTDPRVLSTLDAVEQELSRSGLVQRWTGSGGEGAFVICSYWLATARAMAGQVERAKEIFDAVTVHANDLGLLAEEIDIGTGAQLGNFPQDLSHIGLINAAFEAFGHLDILMNNASVDASGTYVADLDVADFEATMRSNMVGQLICCKHFINHRKQQGGGGKILNTTSVHEEQPRAGAADYDCSKGALRNLTRTLVLEVSDMGMTVNNIAPGMVLTPFNQKAIDDPGFREEQVQSIPLKRAAKPEEIARLAVFLASSDGDYVTGATYVMDGGLMQMVGQGA